MLRLYAPADAAFVHLRGIHSQHAPMCAGHHRGRGVCAPPRHPHARHELLQAGHHLGRRLCAPARHPHCNQTTITDTASCVTPASTHSAVCNQTPHGHRKPEQGYRTLASLPPLVSGFVWALRNDAGRTVCDRQGCLSSSGQKIFRAKKEKLGHEGNRTLDFNNFSFSLK